MNNLTIGDPTQNAILPLLRCTEELIALAASRASGRECHAEIWALPDLGLPFNVGRILGGFFTGAFYRWDSNTPIVPIDATVNSCSVGIYRVTRDVSSEAEFFSLIESARRRIQSDSYYAWNFDKGNHFISYVTTEGAGPLVGGRYLVLHSSAAEFKSQHNGLYPSPGNWYSTEIEVVANEHGRYLRYIKGKYAERFIRIAKMLPEFNCLRLRYFAGLLMGESSVHGEELCIHHYGMPTEDSVGIGCQLLEEASPFYILLTRPMTPFYLMKANADGDNVCWIEGQRRYLTPHGLGIRVDIDTEFDLFFERDGLVLNGQKYGRDMSLQGLECLTIRGGSGPMNMGSLLSQFNARCPSEALGELSPVYSFYNDRRP